MVRLAAGSGSPTVWPDRRTALSSYDDDIEFDFFDEPETEEAPRTRRRPRRERSGPPRPPSPPTGLVPLARLVGLIALAIAIVVAFVFWVGACQGKSTHDQYASYATKVRTVAASSDALGREFAAKLVSGGLKQADLEQSLQQYAQQEQQEYDQATQIRPPGPLRQIHQHLVDAIELRAKGLAALGQVLAAWTPKNTSATIDSLASQAELLTASDVVWEQLYRVPATQQLKAQGITGVVIPKSSFVPNTELVSARSFGVLLNNMKGGTSTGGGTVSGLHGSQLVSVVANPGNTQLTTATATTVKVSADLAFAATVEDSGNFQENGVVVHLTITAGSATINRTQTIPTIAPKTQQTVTFGNFNLPTAAFGNRATVKVDVAPVPGETNTSNNTATYTVFFTLG
ncbi:MAG TPA: hypothetical protein VJQ85_12640 [Gaiellaceae bacterium]|nr:hypothetical protein [Gaiellaceae bacterium]